MVVWPYRMSPAAMNTGSLLSWLVMLSTENWEMLSQLLVCTSGSWDGRGPPVRNAKHRPCFCPLLVQLLCLLAASVSQPPRQPYGFCSRKPVFVEGC